MVLHKVNSKPFSCDYCVARFSNKCHLTRHIRLNHNPKNIIICNICDKEFMKKSHLNKHMFKHTGEKPFMCYYPYCKNSYFKKGKLDKHIMLTHDKSKINKSQY